MIGMQGRLVDLMGWLWLDSPKTIDDLLGIVVVDALLRLLWLIIKASGIQIYRGVFKIILIIGWLIKIWFQD